MTRSGSEARKQMHADGVYMRAITKTCDHCKKSFTAVTGGLGALRQRWCQECRGPDGSGTKTLKRYDLSWREFQSLQEVSQDKCMVCSADLKVLKEKDARLVHIDHDHKTGKVRGIVCHRCNQRLAALDDKEWMNQAQAYLEKNK
jgi:glutaredoxin